MKNKDSDFYSEKEVSEKSNENTNNPFCKELSPIEYYNYEKGFDNNIRKCRCTNQEFLSEEFCENCNAFIY